LPGDVTVKVVLGLSLFSGEGYDSVRACQGDCVTVLDGSLNLFI
jgi:hypothetical protein